LCEPAVLYGTGGKKKMKEVSDRRQERERRHAVEICLCLCS